MNTDGPGGPGNDALRIGLLGPMEITRSGALVAVAGRKRGSLLALLALHPNQVIAVDRIVDDLWDGHPPPGAWATLQSHVSHLRRDLGPAGRVLVTRSPGYVLTIDRTSVDIGAFDRDVGIALALGSARETSDALAAALTLWRGPALGEFASASWAVSEVARLEELRAHAIESRVQADLSLGRHLSLVAELEDLVSAHPLRERGWTLLILALQGAGRHVEALRAAQRFRSMLLDTGSTASPAFDRVEQAVLNHEVVPTVRPGDSDTTRTPAPKVTAGGVGQVAPGLPMIGRRPEMAELRSAVATAGGGQRRLVLVTGEPGVGKTRLMSEMADDVERAGGRVLVGHCDDGLEVPFQPFVDALQSFVDARASSPEQLEPSLGTMPEELTRLVPGISKVLPHLEPVSGSDPDLERYRLFEAVTSWLETAAADELVLLVVEDLHWATRPTLQLLRHILRAAGTARLCILATCRVNDLEPRSEHGSLLVDLACDGNAARLDLSGLDEREVVDLIDRWHGLSDGPTSVPESGFATAVSSATGGNPFFIVEILRHLSETSATDDGPGAQLTAADLVPFPPNVNEVVRQRLHRLSDQTETMLTRAAVLGREFSVRTLLGMGNLDEHESVEALDQASRAGFIEAVPGADVGYRFCHALVQEVLVTGMSKVHRALAHHDAGLELERFARDGADHPAVELARHFTAAAGVGEAVRAVRYSRRAGDQALERHAADEAVAHYKTALSLLDRCPDHDEHDRCDLLLKLGEALRRLPGAAHRTTFLLAADLARELGSQSHLARAAKGIARSFIIADEPDHERIEVIETAVAAFGDRVDSTRARLLASLAGERRLAGEHRLSEELMEQAVAIAREVGHIPTVATTQLMHWDLVWHPSTLGIRTSMAAELEGYLTEIEDTPRAARTMARPWMAGEASTDVADMDVSWLKFRIVAVNLVLALESGHGSAAAGHFADLERLAAETGGPFVAWAIPLMRSTLAVAAGRLEEAEHDTLDAAEAVPKDGPQDANAALLGQTVHIYRLQGRHAECATMLEPVLASLPVARAMHALACCELGRRDEAGAALDKLFDGEELLLPRDITWPVGMMMLAEVCQRVGAVDRAEQLASQLLPYQAQFFASSWYFLGPVSHALGTLAATLGDVDGADHWYTDAAARSDAFPAPLFAERARAARSVLYSHTAPPT